MSLPFDSADPAIRLALQHVRLQALTPMAVLMNLTASIICAAVLEPSIKKVSDIFATPFNPSASLLSAYFLATFVLLIGYCAILMIAKKPETRETLVHGVGLRLVFMQWSMGFATVFFTFQWFIAALVFTSISLLLLLWIHITLYMYPPHRSRPLDTAMIHTPLRLLLIVTFLQDLPQILFIVLGWYHHTRNPEQYGTYEWQAVAFIVSFNLVGLIEVAVREDFVWTVAGSWVMIAQLSKRPKPLPVFASNLTFAILYPVVFIGFFFWRRLRSRQKEGQIALPPDATDDDLEVARARARTSAAAHQGV